MHHSVNQPHKTSILIIIRLALSNQKINNLEYIKRHGILHSKIMWHAYLTVTVMQACLMHTMTRVSDVAMQNLQ